MPTNTTTAIFTTPTSELSAVNIILSGIGEAPVNSLSDTTSDVAVALNILAEVSKEVQTEGWQWNTEDDYPLTPGDDGRIKLHPSIVRVHFRDPDDRELVIRGQYVYDRIRHTYIFPRETAIKVTVTLLLAFEQLPEACRRYITQDDDAQDVVQDAFLSIITHIGDFVYQGKGSLRAWATRIAVNQALNFLKRQQQQPLLLNEELLGDLADDDSPPDLYAMDADRLHALIRSLPDGYRTVFNLYAIEGKSHREIAALLGIKENTSASQYHRAKAMLARQIKQYLSQNSPLP